MGVPLGQLFDLFLGRGPLLEFSPIGKRQGDAVFFHTHQLCHLQSELEEGVLGLSDSQDLGDNKLQRPSEQMCLAWSKRSANGSYP